MVRHDCWSLWFWKFKSQYFGRQLVFWRPILPLRGLWFLITLPLPLIHLEPQQDRPTGKNLKIWRNWRPRLLKTRRFNGPTNKSSCSQKPNAFPRRNPLYPTTLSFIPSASSYDVIPFDVIFRCLSSIRRRSTLLFILRHCPSLSFTHCLNFFILIN